MEACAIKICSRRISETYNILSTGLFAVTLAGLGAKKLEMGLMGLVGASGFFAVFAWCVKDSCSLEGAKRATLSPTQKGLHRILYSRSLNPPPNQNFFIDSTLTAQEYTRADAKH